MDAKELLTQLRGKSAKDVLGELRETPEVGVGESFKRGAMEGVLGNLAAVPRLALQGSGLFTPSPMSVLGINDPTDVNLPNVPAPGGDQVLSGILAGVKGAGNMLTGQPPALQENFSGAMNRSAMAREENPTASAFGGASADALTILAGRAPFAKAAKATGSATVFEPGLKRFAQRIWNTPGVQKLARGAGKAAEAGFEGAALASLKDGDPLETAAYAAGTQAAGSVALQLADLGGIGDIGKGNFLKGFGKLGVAAFMTGSAFQFMDAAIPGDKNWLIENIEAGYDKVLLAIIGGAIAGAGGAGRMSPTGAIGENFPILADAITAVPRGVIISFWEDLARDDEAKAAFKKLQEAPQAHTPAQLKTLEKGIEERKFGDTVRRMLEEDEKYREIYEAPDPRLAGVPKK